jgi:UDP-glucose 4-epimerase
MLKARVVRQSMNERVLVTGGAGFIGSAILRELHKLTYEIFVIDNLSQGKREHAPIGDESFFQIDILDFDSVANCARAISPTWVMHLAGIHFIPYCNSHPFESSSINLQGTVNVLDALRGVDSVRRVFFASTAAVYADSATTVSEMSPTVPLDIYGLTKFVGERLVNEFHCATGVPCIIGRLFNAYGPRETNAHLVPEILRQVLEGRRRIELGNVTTRRDYIHTSDMVRAITKLMVMHRDGVDAFNIGSGHSHTAREIVEYFERAVNYSLEITIADSRVRKQDRAVLQANTEKIRQATGWSPLISFQEGINALVQGESLVSDSG